MKIVLANDHSAVDYKFMVAEFLKNKGYEIINVGTDTYESMDYPDSTKEACDLIVENKADFGIIICGTGIGVSIAANKINGIRAALIQNEISARLSKQHNNANVLTFGARVQGIELILSCIDSYLNASFECGRHQNRVDKIMKLEQE